MGSYDRNRNRNRNRSCSCRPTPLDCLQEPITDLPSPDLQAPGIRMWNTSDDPIPRQARRVIFSILFEHCRRPTNSLWML